PRRCAATWSTSSLRNRWPRSGRFSLPSPPGCTRRPRTCSRSPRSRGTEDPGWEIAHVNVSSAANSETLTLMARTLVHLLRHGEVHNPDSILYGRLAGYNLSDLGNEMARMAADDLVARGANVTHVVASPLERAQQTAAPIAESYGLPIVTDERVLEAESKLQGQPVSVRPGLLLKPKNLRRLLNPFLPSWGEPYDAQVARMIEAIKSARAAAEGSEAVLVSHQSPIWTTRLFLEGRAYL